MFLENARHFASSILLVLCLSINAPATALADYTCGSGSVPPGVVCCSSTTYCERGYTCGPGSKCIKDGSPMICGNGKFCGSDEACVDNGQHCVKLTSERYCGGREYCEAGYACIGNGKCLPTGSPRYCGGGHYCNEGYHCVGDKCAPDHVDMPDFGSDSGGGSSGSDDSDGTSGGSGKIASGCLRVGESKRVGGMIGECTKKDGSTGHWYFTDVTSTMAEGCPKSIEFDYMDPEDGYQSFYTPFKVQTCDAPPVAIDVK